MEFTYQIQLDGAQRFLLREFVPVGHLDGLAAVVVPSLFDEFEDGRRHTYYFGTNRHFALQTAADRGGASVRMFRRDAPSMEQRLAERAD